MLRVANVGHLKLGCVRCVHRNPSLSVALLFVSLLCMHHLQFQWWIQYQIWEIFLPNHGLSRVVPEVILVLLLLLSPLALTSLYARPRPRLARNGQQRRPVVLPLILMKDTAQESMLYHQHHFTLNHSTTAHQGLQRTRPDLTRKAADRPATARHNKRSRTRAHKCHLTRARASYRQLRTLRATDGGVLLALMLRNG